MGVLEKLRAAGYRLLVVSNWDSSLPRLLANLGLTKYFEAIVVSAHVGASKPAGKIFDEALRLAGVPCEAALHIGDSCEEDFDGARAAGLNALLLDRSGRADSAVPTIRTLEEVAAWLCPASAP